MADAERFSVWLFFPDGSHHREADSLDPESAVRLAHNLTRRPATKIGIIREIRIVDRDDFTVFQWKYREGVTYPHSIATENPNA